jgi:hypothetical protein
MKHDIGKCLIIIFALLAALAVTVKAEATGNLPAPSFTCWGGVTTIHCESKATWNAWVTWRVYIINGPDEVQVAENSGGYNASVRFYLSTYVSIIEMEVAGQVLRLYAHRTSTGVRTWKYDPKRAEATEEAPHEAETSEVPEGSRDEQTSSQSEE